MRWRQCRHTGEFIPVDEAARQQSRSAAVQGDIQSFISPVDGSVITDRKQLREHNKRNGVVNSAEYSPEYYARKAKEREDFYAGKTSAAETRARRVEMYEHMVRAERNQN